MPVKIEYSNNNNRYSPTSSFDCNMIFNEDFVDQPDFISETRDFFPCFDEMWNNFIPTPPQSPPFKLERIEDIEERIKDLDDDEVMISHDCMWSGQCSEGMCKSMYSNKPISNNTCFRPETPFNLSTSPQSTFSYISSYDLSMNDNFLEDDNQEQQQQQQQLMESNVYAMANDHSYDSAQKVSDSSENHSLIRKDNGTNKSTISQSRISKMKCKKISGKKQTPSASSILNNSNVSTNGLKKEKNGSVLKPTIILANFNDIEDSFRAKYKVSIKKNQLNIDDANNANTARSVIQVKSLSTNITSLPMNSPACSDSEESSLSFSSGDNDQKTSSPPVKRREHNDSERKRRDHLRNSFNNLRDQVPKLKTSQKRPPRIMILHEATNYVQHLIQKNDELEDEYKQEIEKRNRLMEILKNSNELSSLTHLSNLDVRRRIP